MIAACPMCAARYRIDPGRLRPEGARLRCSRCEAVFRVVPPRGEPALPEPTRSAPAAAPAPALPEPARSVAAPPPAPAPEPLRPAQAPAAEDARRERLVLVADPDPDSGKRTAGALSDWGLEPLLVHDGVEAILAIQRSLPRAVVLDAALPKMFGFQVCELVKRNESLRGIRVVLVGAIHHRERYRRPPRELYGADAYVERPELPDALREHLTRFGLPLAAAWEPAPPPPPLAPAPEAARPLESPTAEIPLPELPPAAVPAPARSAPEAPAAAAAALPARLLEEIAKAERLARIIVSDIALYNPEKFEAAIASGSVVEVMEGELAEGRALITQRVPPELRATRDFLREELLRVARLREGR